MSGRHPQPAVDGQDMLHAKKRFPFVDGCPDGVLPLAALFTFLAVAMGAVVCATGSGDPCPTWPGCRPDQTAPQWQLSPLTEFTHRVVAMAAGPLVLAAAVVSRRLPGPDRWVRILPVWRSSALVQLVPSAD